MQKVHTHSSLAADAMTVASKRFAHPRKNVAAFGLHEGMRVADFGAGSGAYTLSVALSLQGTGAVYAIDIQRDLLRRIHSEATRLGYQNVELIWADLEVPKASKLADGSIDLVVISNLLFQVPDKEQIVKEARRIVKPNGHVNVIDWSDSFGAMGPLEEDVVTKEAALVIAKAAGLSLEREFFAGAHHYGLMLRAAPL